MSQTKESRLNSEVGHRHAEDGPFHFRSVKGDSPIFADTKIGTIPHFPVLNQDDRIRKVFGLSEDAPLPPVCEETLATYYDYLLANLLMPFEALYCQHGGKMHHLVYYTQVTELLNPREANDRSHHGLFGRAQHYLKTLELPLSEFGVMEGNPNCQLIDDYAYWFVNCR